MLSVVGKCVVLEYKDYCTYRPTQYTEGEVFVCENLFDEGKRVIRPLGGGLKKYTHSRQARQAALADKYEIRMFFLLAWTCFLCSLV